MKKLRVLLFSPFVIFGFSSLSFGQYQDNNFCCDPTSAFSEDFFTCDPEGESFEFGNADTSVDDCDCSDADGPACIPIDGGLSLLALAGGGLATAAMRRRREEEEAAAQGAA